MDINDNNDNNDNQGLITKIWGESIWKSSHAITFFYPENPTQQDKENYKTYFEKLGYVLPCVYCREFYNMIINKGVTKLDDKIMQSRRTLTEWFYNVHEAVNKKQGIDYGVSYNDLEKRFDAYKIPCNHTNEVNNKSCIPVNLEDNSYAFKVASIKECPIIPYKIGKQFIDYAKKRDLSNDHFYILNYEDDFKQNLEIWDKRNEECGNIISKMRINGIPSIEKDNLEWKGLPTIEELKLILRLSSNLTSNELLEIIKKIPNEFAKIYKISSNV